MSKEHVKIQLNSLEALERLIGGDSEIEIDIRNSVAKNFFNKHIKGIISDSLGFKIREETHDFLFKNKKSNVEMQESVKKEIMKRVKISFDHLLDDEIKKQEVAIRKSIEDTLLNKDYLESIALEKIREQIREDIKNKFMNKLNDE